MQLLKSILCSILFLGLYSCNQEQKIKTSNIFIGDYYGLGESYLFLGASSVSIDIFYKNLISQKIVGVDYPAGNLILDSAAIQELGDYIQSNCPQTQDGVNIYSKMPLFQIVVIGEGKEIICRVNGEKDVNAYFKKMYEYISKSRHKNEYSELMRHVRLYAEPDEP